jgi:hypothetical protein
MLYYYGKSPMQPFENGDEPLWGCFDENGLLRYYISIGDGDGSIVCARLERWTGLATVRCLEQGTIV